MILMKIMQAIFERNADLIYANDIANEIRILIMLEIEFIPFATWCTSSITYKQHYRLML